MLYMISMICATLTAGFMVILGAVMHQGGLLVVLLAPAVFILMVAYSRVMLELAIVFFRIAENTAVLPRLAAGESNTKMIAFTS